MKRAVALAVGATLATALTAGAADKPKKPTLELRVAPRMAFSPVTALFTAELKGGDDVEEFYCPEVEWEWDDGGKSVQESDCPPFEAGVKLERRFTGTHEYRRAGSYTIRITLRRTGNAFAAQSVRLAVRPGLADPSD